MILFNTSNDNESISYNDNSQADSITFSPYINQKKYLCFSSNINQNKLTNLANDKSLEQNIISPTQNKESQNSSIIIKSSAYENNKQVNKEPTPVKNNNNKNTKPTIFLFKKTHQPGTKKRGRKVKNFVYIERKGVHDKKRTDNIITRIKRKLFSSIIIHINSLCKNSEIKEVRDIKLKNLNPHNVLVCSRKQNLNLLNTTIEHMLLNWSISSKYGKKSQERMVKIRENQANIVSIIMKDKHIKMILSMTFDELLSIYSHKEKQIGIFEKFKGIDVFLEELKRNGEEDKYLEKLLFVSQNFMSIIENKRPRTKKQKIVKDI